MADFHFLYPMWLLLLLVIPVLVWLFWKRNQQSDWHQIIDPQLAPFVLSGGSLKRSWHSAAIASVAWLVAVIALAGPTWEKREVPVYQNPHALVIALDLSGSMYAQDVKPSRLQQARFKVIDILKQRQTGQTALVVFAGDAFEVTPLTDDTDTIEAQIAKLAPDVMPVQGSRLQPAILQAQALLKQAKVKKGDILLISDGVTDTQQAQTAAQQVLAEGFNVSILAVGTEEGAPVPLPQGGFLQKQNGETVIPKLNFDDLVTIANAGGGVISSLKVNDSDIDALETLWQQNTPKELTLDKQTREVGVWVNQGYWLVLLLLPVALLMFRRGWLWVLVIVLLPRPEPVLAAWDDVWKTPNQQAYQVLEANPEQAQQLFEDTNWKAAAAYKAGDFAGATQLYEQDNSVTGQYNYANALVKSQQLEEALKAYDRVLAKQPEHEDAKHNREQVKKALEQQKQNQNKQDQQNQDQQNQDQQNQNQNNQDQQSQQQQNQNSQQSNDQSQQQQGQQDQQSSQNEQDQKQSQSEQDKQKAEQEAEQARKDQEKAQAEAAKEQQKAEQEKQEKPSKAQQQANAEQREQQQATEQWLRRIPDDPAGLWRRKFLYQYQQRGQQAQGEGW